VRPAAPLPLVAVAHGSRDPRSAACVRDLARAVRSVAPELDVRVAFLDLSEPKVTDVLGVLRAEGHPGAVVVPLLLGSAFHARVDLPALVDQVAPASSRFRVRISDVLGIDPRLEAVALGRLAGTGSDLTDPGLGIVLAAVGSSSASANDALARMARRWQGSHPVAGVTPAFASTSPDVPAAIARLRARGARRFAIASWFLAPGLLPDRVAAQAATIDPEIPIAPPLGADPRVAAQILRRYTQITTAATTRTA
jgi:sirohydrochlorin ferrochelatase